MALLPIAPFARATAAAAATPANAPLPPGAVLVVPGHGWGHGRGMGQWGAYGMARDGSSYSSIVKHFYSGVSLSQRAAETIRVLVETSPDVVVTSDSPLSAYLADGTLAGKSTTGSPFLRARYDGTNYRVERSANWNGPWSAVKQSRSYVVFKHGADLLQLVFNNGNVRWYRGNIVARYSSADGMRSIDDVALDHYLYGVVPRESPSSWPTEALKSQAVAARTYALYKKTNARARGTMFDICATTMCQVYGGYARAGHVGDAPIGLEASASNAAVGATTGKVLLYSGDPILAEFSSSTGGYTAPGGVAYQKAVPDPGDAASPLHAWTAKVTAADVERAFPRIGRLIDVKVTQRNGFGDWGGRVLQMDLVGTDATQTISGGSWRSAFEWPSRSNGVRSSWFAVNYWRGTLVSAPGTVSVPSGGGKTIQAQVKNTGNTAWRVGGPVRIAASSSRFGGSDWVSATRPGSVARNLTTAGSTAVRPGEVAEFDIPIHAESVAPGVYTQRFGVVADGASPMDAAFTTQIQVLAGWIDGTTNMLTNGSFESGIGAWRTNGLASGDGISTLDVRDGRRSVYVAGGGTKTVYQMVSTGGGRARTFLFGGWNRASSATAGTLDLTATAVYADGTRDQWHVAYPASPHAWTYGEDSFTTSASKELTAVALGARESGGTGDVFFDSLRLVETPVTNPSFERGINGWTTSGLVSGDGATGADGRDGTASLVVAGAAATKRATQTLAFAGRRGERVAVSAWNRATGSDSAGGALAVTLTLVNTDGSRSSRTIDFARAAHDWTFGREELSAPKNFSSAALTVTSANQTGSAWFDDIEVSKSWVQNASFESNLDAWRANNLQAGDGVVSSAREGARAVRISGGASRNLAQYVPFAGTPGRRFVISGWNMTRGATSAGGVSLRAVLRNTDGTNTAVSVPFASATHPWSYGEKLVVAPKKFSRVDVYVAMSNGAGFAYFDGVRLRTP
jgi:SpoIID/LytB domain protein